MMGMLVAVFSNLTVLLLIVSLVIFSILCVQSKKIKSFQFQMSIVLLVLIGAEIIDVLVDFDYIENHFLADLGSQIHVFSMSGIALVFWARYLHAERARKKFVEDT